MRSKIVITILMFFITIKFSFLNAYKPTQFVVEVLTYNNQEYCSNNLNSILNQNYEHFRVVIINDASTDYTGTIIKRILAHHPKGRHVKYLENQKRLGAMANHIQAIYSCKDFEIVVQVDGDDSLRHPNVLKTLDAVYQNPGVWLTYGSHVLLSSGKRGPYSSCIPSEIIEAGTIRKYKWCTSHVKSFYVALFNKIKTKSFMYKNKLVSVASDIAFMLPMVEMAGEHSYYIDDLLYVYNDLSSQNDHKHSRDLVIETTNYLRKLPPYKPIRRLFAKRNDTQKKRSQKVSN